MIAAGRIRRYGVNYRRDGGREQEQDRAGDGITVPGMNQQRLQGSCIGAEARNCQNAVVGR